MLSEGWNVKAGKPTKVRTTARDLDAAFDLAAQYYGEPLEQTSEWGAARYGLGSDEVYSCVECDVAPAADVHGDGS